MTDRDDELDPEAVGRALLGQDPTTSRYAVPMSTLFAGTFVAHADQVVLHPVPRPDVDVVPTGPVHGGGGLGDGD